MKYVNADLKWGAAVMPMADSSVRIFRESVKRNGAAFCFPAIGLTMAGLSGPIELLIAETGADADDIFIICRLKGVQMMNRSKIYTLEGSSHIPAPELIKSLEDELLAELVSHIERDFQEGKIVLLTFERFYMRNGSNATLSILLTESKEKTTADVIGSGGGEGIFGFSWGANSNFAQKAAEILQRLGFHVVGSE